MEKISLAQAESILSVQDRIYRTVDDHGLSAGIACQRGVQLDAEEEPDHHSCQCFSYSSRYLSQVQIELIDILHNSLSDLINECGGNLTDAAGMLLSRSNPELAHCHFDGAVYVLRECDIPMLLKLIAADAGSDSDRLPLLEVAFDACGLNWNRITILCIAKHVLNVFRDNHGYKNGCYAKIWGYTEDYIHLVEIVSYLDPAATSFSMQIYALLNERYAFYALAPQPIICVSSAPTEVDDVSGPCRRSMLGDLRHLEPSDTY